FLSPVVLPRALYPDKDEASTQQGRSSCDVKCVLEHTDERQGKSYLREQNTTPSKHRLLLIFYISLPVLIITATVLIKQNNIKELCYREETESERSVSEESSSNSTLSPSVSNSL
uniref:Uncharacterized protein n=1 Tax=Mustela putorius furo TaxID=9669 RepID=M3YDI0_MUSPF